MMASFHNEVIIVVTLIAKEFFQTAVDSYCFVTVAENEASWILQLSEQNWGARCHLMQYTYMGSSHNFL